MGALKQHYMRHHWDHWINHAPGNGAGLKKVRRPSKADVQTPREAGKDDDLIRLSILVMKRVVYNIMGCRGGQPK